MYQTRVTQVIPMTLLIQFILYVPFTSTIYTQIHIPSDDLSLYFELGLNNNMMIKRDIVIKLYHRADWNKVNSIIRRNY